MLWVRVPSPALLVVSRAISGSGEQALEIGAFLEADRVIHRVPGAFDFAQRSASSFGSLMDGREKPVGAYAAGAGS